MPSQFLMQVVTREDGQVVAGLEPGSRVETDIIDQVVTRAKALGIGFGKTEATVESILRTVWADVLYELKSQVRPPDHV